MNRIHVSKKMMASLLLMVLAAGDIVFTLKASSLKSASILQATTASPTFDYPPDLQTSFAVEQQTHQAVILTPSATGTLWSFLPFPNTEVPLPPPPSTPAGSGAIVDTCCDSIDSLGKVMGIWYRNLWYADVAGHRYTVFAGSDYQDDSQGMLYITVDGNPLPGGGKFPTPTRSGPIRVVGANGMRLILATASGETFYFDVPGQQYATSLDTIVPTVTPISLPPSLPPTLMGDAPHSPDLVRQYSPVNTPLSFIISHAGDEQWFRFKLPSQHTIQVRLDNLPANYDLYVYSVTRVRYAGHDGQSTNPGTTPELVTIQNAPADDYMVQVVRVNGAFDPTHPYRLEFNIVQTVADLQAQMAQCVTDKGLLNSLTVKINAQQWSAFINEVQAQTDKKIPKPCADQLIQMATYLLNHPTPTPTKKP